MIVVDGVRDFSENVLAVLDVADKIAIVTLQEVLAIRRGRWAYGILRKIGFDPRDITVVVNRYNPQHQISLGTLRQMFDPATVLTVVREEALALQSLDRGTPLLDLNPRHLLTQNIAAVAARMRGLNVSTSLEPEETTASRSLGDKLKFWKKT